MIPPQRAPVEPGQVVVLGIRGENGLAWHRGRVARHEADLVWIEASRNDGPPMAPAVGEVVVLDAWRPADARYSFRARVDGLEPNSPEQVRLRLLEGTRIQRREYFRVTISASEDALVFASGAAEAPIRLLLRDLSASGLRALSSVPLRAGEQLWIKLLMSGQAEPLHLCLRVVWVNRDFESSHYVCEVGAAFVDVPAALRERLVHFILRIQREQLRRGLR